MARKRMVTRTIVATKANVMCLDVQAGEPCNKVVTVPHTIHTQFAKLCTQFTQFV